LEERKCDSCKMAANNNPFDIYERAVAPCVGRRVTDEGSFGMTQAVNSLIRVDHTVGIEACTGLCMTKYFAGTVHRIIEVSSIRLVRVLSLHSMYFSGSNHCCMVLEGFMGEEHVAVHVFVFGDTNRMDHCVCEDVFPIPLSSIGGLNSPFAIPLKGYVWNGFVRVLLVIEEWNDPIDFLTTVRTAMFGHQLLETLRTIVPGVLWPELEDDHEDYPQTSDDVLEATGLPAKGMLRPHSDPVNKPLSPRLLLDKPFVHKGSEICFRQCIFQSPTRPPSISIRPVQPRVEELWKGIGKGRYKYRFLTANFFAALENPVNDSLLRVAELPVDERVLLFSKLDKLFREKNGGQDYVYFEDVEVTVKFLGYWWNNPGPLQALRLEFKDSDSSSLVQKSGKRRYFFRPDFENEKECIQALFCPNGSYAGWSGGQICIRFDFGSGQFLVDKLGFPSDTPLGCLEALNKAFGDGNALTAAPPEDAIPAEPPNPYDNKGKTK